MAMSNIQTLSDRDMFRFDHWLRLSYETTAAQIRAIAADIRELLAHNAVVDPSSIVVRLIQFGQSSLDLQLVAYVRAPQWNDFLQVQEELLLDIMGIVERRGARITLPAQIMHMAGAAAGLGHR
jgi:MscS family membrane protein